MVGNVKAMFLVRFGILLFYCRFTLYTGCKRRGSLLQVKSAYEPKWPIRPELRGAVRVKRLAQEHNTMSPARARTQTPRSGVKRTNHEATAPPTSFKIEVFI